MWAIGSKSRILPLIIIMLDLINILSFISSMFSNLCLDFSFYRFSSYIVIIHTSWCLCLLLWIDCGLIVLGCHSWEINRWLIFQFVDVFILLLDDCTNSWSRPLWMKHSFGFKTIIKLSPSLIISGFGILIQMILSKAILYFYRSIYHFCNAFILSWLLFHISILMIKFVSPMCIFFISRLNKPIISSIYTPVMLFASIQRGHIKPSFDSVNFWIIAHVHNKILSLK